MLYIIQPLICLYIVYIFHSILVLIINCYKSRLQSVVCLTLLLSETIADADGPSHRIVPLSRVDAKTFARSLGLPSRGFGYSESANHFR